MDIQAHFVSLAEEDSALMKSILKQPLVHFLFIGLGLFVLYEFAGENEEVDDKTIVVNRATLRNFLQFRSRTFDRSRFDSQLEALDAAGREKLIDEYVREEVLYREALTKELYQNDYIIRQRLIQRLEFGQGRVGSVPDPTDEEVQKYFEENKDSYFVEPNVTFAHVFFSFEPHGKAGAKERAEKKLAELNSAAVPFDQSVHHGDRFPYHVNYVERERAYIVGHFGEAMTALVMELEPDEKKWHGPYESSHGLHLVMLTKRTSGRTLKLATIADEVKKDVRVAAMEAETQKAVDQMIEGYTVRVEFPAVNTPAKAEAESQRGEP